MKERGRNKPPGLSITRPSSEPALRNQFAFAVPPDGSGADTNRDFNNWFSCN